MARKKPKKAVLKKKVKKIKKGLLHKLSKKADKIKKHLRKMKSDLQSAVRLKQIESRMKR